MSFSLNNFLIQCLFLVSSLSLDMLCSREVVSMASLKKIVVVRNLEKKNNFIFLYITQDKADWNNLKLKGKVTLCLFFRES